jgi:hypothetical protein
MLQFTCLPKPVTNWLHMLRLMFHHRHHRVFCWLLVCQAISQEKATIKGLARLAPRHIAEWHLRRLLTATYWNWRVLLWWFADQVIAILQALAAMELDRGNREAALAYPRQLAHTAPDDIAAQALLQEMERR